jgi:hypothetical protein
MIEGTNWLRLYFIAALIGAGFGLILSLGVLAFDPGWPAGWSVLGGALLGVLLAGASHLGVTCQLRRMSRGRR